MEWVKVNWKWDLETSEHFTNVPYGWELLVSNGEWVKYVNEHGWDKQEYYFHDGLGKLEGVTHFMIFPNPPEKQ
jgi:hypothetical protein